MLLVKTDVGFEVKAEAGTPTITHCNSKEEAIAHMRELGALYYDYIDESMPKCRYWGTS